MNKKVKAIFKGHNKSLGYLTDYEYTLIVEEEKSGKIKIVTDDGNGECLYSSVIRFLENWDCIRNVNQ